MPSNKSDEKKTSASSVLGYTVAGAAVVGGIVGGIAYVGNKMGWFSGPGECGSEGVAGQAAKSLASKIYDDNSLSIGKTPLVKLTKVTEGAKANVFAKIEGRNPAYSVKCRIGAAMIWDAESSGKLVPGMTIVEPTSGNTGIALAFVAASKGYECILVMPETMSVERRKMMKALGAKIILTPGPKAMKGAIAKATEMAQEEPEKYFMPSQFTNPANPLIHELTTGPEIYEATKGAMDVLVAGIGTGGTISGISKYWKKTLNRPLVSVGVEPIHSPVITQHLNNQDIIPGPHKIQGIGAGFIPETLDLSVVDEIETVDNDEAMAMARRLASEEGILCGISCGAAAAVALRLASRPGWEGKNIVVVLPDSGERYLSSALYASEEFKALETATASDELL